MYNQYLSLLLFAGLTGCSVQPRYVSEYSHEHSSYMARQHATRVVADRISQRTPASGPIDQKLKFETFVLPVMPAEAIEKRIEGDVEFELVLDPSGSPRSVRIIRSPHEILSVAVREATMQWRIRPATSGGKPVSITLHQIFGFRSQI